MGNFNNEQLEKAKQAKSAEELLELAKANKVAMTADEAKAYYAQLHPTSGELADDELDNVAGGGCGHGQKYEYPPEGTLVTCLSKVCPTCGSLQGIFHLNGRNEWYVACKNGCPSYDYGNLLDFGSMDEDPTNKLIW